MTDELTPATLSIVVGTFNRRDQIERTIQSVIAQTSVPFHIFVTDAGSTDGTVEYLESIRSDRLTPILEGQRVGQARAYNNVFEIVTTPYVCWLSDDNEVIDGSLDRAVRILQADPAIGMVGLKVRDVIGPFANALYVGGLSCYGILNVNQGVLPTAVLRKVGYFNEAFRDYGIDPDLTARVLLQGHDIVYTRNVALLHYRNWETDPSSPEFQKMTERQLAYLERYRTTFADRLSRSPTLLAKRAFWHLVKRTLRLNIDDRTHFLGLYGRDWQNIICSRSMNLFAEVARRQQDYHLRQRGLK
jgi:GT2 family glycosyltransferase